ncbi:MAG: hypothetical protein COA71_05745 [SAR86 cluster bacterium]|uniref:Uncharacterized protein n=1 Tax=SAR86 cluster bacterium TaxID=2030880 RepID=A0A2A5CDY4_9GAMM|nr:MAG: hypothetical protein COA71_05745 [SAR86 cluster bacterium]
MANETLGSIECLTCKNMMDVCQANRRGHHLYTRCPECKSDQTTGATRQTRLWYETKWRDDLPDGVPIKPSNVVDRVLTETLTEPLTDEASNSAASDDLTESDFLTETLTETKPKGSVGRLVGFVLLSLVVGVGAWKMA